MEHDIDSMLGRLEHLNEVVPALRRVRDSRDMKTAGSPEPYHLGNHRVRPRPVLQQTGGTNDTLRNSRTTWELG